MISVTNLDLGYQQCSELHNLLTNTGGDLIKELETITNSLKVNWLGSDAKEHINNLIDVHDALASLVSEGITSTATAGQSMVAMQRVRSLNGAGGVVGDELLETIPEIQTLSKVEDTSEYNVKPGVSSDYQNLSQMKNDYTSFIGNFRDQKEALMSNWTDGANRTSVEQLFNTFLDSSDSYEKIITSAESNLSTAVSNLTQIID